MVDAHGRHIKYWLQDHDTYFIHEEPPTENLWYEVFHEEDVRLLWCVINQTNDETLARIIEVRWTIDGNVYLLNADRNEDTLYYYYRDRRPSPAGLGSSSSIFNAGYYIDKRGLDFKIEMRITEAPLTNQVLDCWCVLETLEIT